MSVFSKIFDKIFRRAEAATPAGTAPSSTAASGGTAASTAPQGGGGGTAVMQEVDVEAVLNGLAAQNSQKLNWRTSIVDLMKLVGMESSLAERKELADELGYSGDKGDSAAMNIWLHKQVMKKLEENGGKVPASLKD